jgi:hypothetical protein
MATDRDGHVLPTRDFRNAQEEGQWRRDDARKQQSASVVNSLEESLSVMGAGRSSRKAIMPNTIEQIRSVRRMQQAEVYHRKFPHNIHLLDKPSIA